MGVLTQNRRSGKFSGSAAENEIKHVRDEIGQDDGIGKAASNSTSPKSARRGAVTGGGGSVLSGRRCFVTFVSSRPACR